MRTAVPTGWSAVRVPLVYLASSSRSVNGVAEERSWIDRPDSALPEVFVTVPVTVTGLPGCAIRGLIEPMTTETGDWLDELVSPACPPACWPNAGGASATAQALAIAATAAIASITRTAAARAREQRTPGMLLPFAGDDTRSDYPQCPCRIPCHPNSRAR